MAYNQPMSIEGIAEAEVCYKHKIRVKLYSNQTIKCMLHVFFAIGGIYYLYVGA